MNVTIEVVLTFASGFGCSNMDEWWPCADQLLGRQLYNHEFADPAVWRELRDVVLGQYPALAPFDDIDKDNWRARIKEAKELFGESLVLAPTDHPRTESPVDSAKRLFPDKPIIAIEVPGDAEQ